MMDNRYKIILSGSAVYREIELAPDMQRMRLGTEPDCDVRLRKDMFFGKIELIFEKHDSEWSVYCSDNLYITVGDVRKLMTINLTHGDEVSVRYQISGNEVFSLSFMIDFDYEKKDYSTEIDIAGETKIKIGGTEDCDIRFSDSFLGADALVLNKKNGAWNLVDLDSKYGVFVNGVRISEETRLEDCDFFSIVSFSFYYKEEKLYTTSKSGMQTGTLGRKETKRQTTCFEYPKFNRNTRVQYEIPEDDLEIQQPPQKPEKPQKNLATTLMPSLVMLVTIIILRGVIGGGGTFVIYSAISMSMGIIMSIITYRQNNKNYKEDTVKREAAYKKYIEEKEEKIQLSRANELRLRRMIYESPEDSLKKVESFGRRLFERSLGDKDYLQVYVGAGRIESSNQVSFTKQEFVDMEDPISLLPEQISEKYRFIESAPITSDFYSSCGVGIVGEHALLEEMLKNITLDIAIRHFYRDVRLVYLLEENYLESFTWLRWLRNVQNDRLGVRNIVCDEESKNLILEHLYTILSERENALQGSDRSGVFEEHYVVFVTNTASIGTHPLFKYIKNGAQFGFTFVFLEEYEENIPQGCTEIIRLDSEKTGFALKSVNGDIASEFVYPMIATKTAEQTALKLGAVYVDEVSLEGDLTKNITLYELLEIMSAEELDLNKRWDCSQVYKTMAAPIGVKINNEVVSLDISDKDSGHGPHGLVAGTTGSGKSELLQTYILSLATLFHPYDVGFMIIDFKGGGMANQFQDLPHLIGTITNIDGREINRSLQSIKAELVKRQELFSEAGVNHINDYIKMYKGGLVSIPMPHLIIIVDEFAELKSEYPDFMKELISAARIGRTLGVHLILATQKPAGVVDAQIWSNSKFKLCLKVQTKEDSVEVIKTPLAAEIVEAGRAYFQVGNNEIFELIQSAYSGAKVPAGNSINEKAFEINECNLWGKRRTVYTNKNSAEAVGNMTQLEAIVNYVRQFCEVNHIEKLPGICLPSLEEIIKTDALDYSISDEEGYIVPVGFYDDPEMQRQGIVELDVSKENVYIVGSSQTGKTVLLQTIAYGLIRKYSPEQINLYIVDCGSMVLKIFENAFQVGGVVLSNEEEKCKNLFKMLTTIVRQRKEILSGKGVGNFASYLEAGYTDLPMTVVMIDNMAAFKEYFPDQADQLGSLTREAQGVGISFIITAAASNALNYRTRANFSRNIVLNCNDTSEYGNVFGRCRMTPRENAGRALFMMDKRILEMQVAIFGKGEKEADRSREMQAFIEQRNQEFDKHAYRIPMVPDRLILLDKMEQNQEFFRNTGIIPLGMGFETVDYSTIDLNQAGSLALIGDNDCRIQFVKTFLTTLAKNIVFHNVEAIVIDDKQKSLGQAESLGFVRSYTSNVSEGLAFLGDFYSQLEERENAENVSELSTVMIVIHNQEMMKQICADKNLSKELASALKRSNDTKAFILLSQVENAAVGFNSSDVMKTIRDERQGILFAPITENKLYEISGRVKADAMFDKTMAYRFDNGSISKIKVFE